MGQVKGAWRGRGPGPGEPPRAGPRPSLGWGLHGSTGGGGPSAGQTNTFSESGPVYERMTQITKFTPLLPDEKKFKEEYCFCLLNTHPKLPLHFRFISTLDPGLP